MNVENIKRILIDNRRFVKDIPFVERKISLEEELNYVFVGLRQAGKSYLMYQRIHQLLESGHSIDEIVYLNLDDERLVEMKCDDLDLIMQAHYQLNDCQPILFLDELQNIEHWEHFARRLANEKYRVYVTGSNAKMLSAEVATTLGGRYMIQEVYPYSFSEYLQANDFTLHKNWEYDTRQLNRIRREFDQYFYFGGFPESVSIIQKRQWLSVMYQKIFFGDLVTRYHVRSDKSLKLLVKKLAESVKQPSSYSRLANIVSSAGQKVQTNTIIDFIKYLEETWLMFGISNYAAKFAEKESSKKYYFRDNGILNLFLLDPETSLLENMVAIQLKKKYGDGVYYYNKSAELDFYVPEESIAIQVSYSLADVETLKREVSSLLKIGKRLDAQHFLIITYNEENTMEQDGIKIEILPLWKWLIKTK